MKLRQVIVSLYLLLVAGLGVAGAVLFKDAHDEYSQLEMVQSENQRKLAQAQQRLTEQKKVLDRLRSDPEFVDRVIRMKMGYAKPDEYIFRFEDDGGRGTPEPFIAPRTDK